MSDESLLSRTAALIHDSHLARTEARRAIAEADAVTAAVEAIVNAVTGATQSRARGKRGAASRTRRAAEAPGTGD